MKKGEWILNNMTAKKRGSLLYSIHIPLTMLHHLEESFRVLFFKYEALLRDLFRIYRNNWTVFKHNYSEIPFFKRLKELMKSDVQNCENDRCCQYCTLFFILFCWHFFSHFGLLFFSIPFQHCFVCCRRRYMLTAEWLHLLHCTFLQNIIIPDRTF